MSGYQPRSCEQKLLAKGLDLAGFKAPVSAVKKVPEPGKQDGTVREFGLLQLLAIFIGRKRIS